MDRRRLAAWLRRYGPAEVAATAGALVGALLGARVAGAAGAAFAADLCEGLAFYAVVVGRELRAERAATNARSLRRVLRDLLGEFGPAEVLDSLAVRPLAFYVGPLLTGDLVTGTVAGKVAADLVFYTIAARAYEMRRARRAAALLGAGGAGRARGRGPYRPADPGQVVRTYCSLAAALPVDAIHHTTACDLDPLVLAALDRAGCRFTVASYAELFLLRRAGAALTEVLFGNPAAPAGDVTLAHRIGCRYFAVDGVTALEKVAVHAPGAAVYVWLTRGNQAGSGSGVGPDEAVALLRAAARLGLRPYGVSFDLRTRVARPESWDGAVAAVGVVATRLARDGIRLEMIGIGGGFPVEHGDGPPLTAFGAHILRALDRLPYRLHVVAEPGRALVAPPPAPARAAG